MIGEKLGKFLITVPEVSDKLTQIGHGVKIFLGRIPQQTGSQKISLPAVIINVIGGAPDYHLNGEIGDLATVVQVDVHANSRKEANEIAEAIRLAPLSGINGAMWDEDTEIKEVTIENERELDDAPTDSSDRWTHRHSTDYRITYVRSVA